MQGLKCGRRQPPRPGPIRVKKDDLVRTRKQSEFPRLRGVKEFDESRVPRKTETQRELERCRSEKRALARELTSYLQQYEALSAEARERRQKQLKRLAAHAGLAAQLDTVLTTSC